MKWLLFVVVLVITCAAQSSDEPKRIFVEGHRGARWVLPENTLPGFRYAIESGADYLELDVAVTKDNVVVVSHDLEIKPSICKGPVGMPRVVRKLTVAQIKLFDCGWMANPDFPAQKALPGTRMPTLEELLSELTPIKGFHFNIEVKSNPERPELTPSPREFTRQVLALIRQFQIEDRVIVQSFDFRILQALKQQAPEIPRAALWSSGDEPYLEVAKRAGDVLVVSPNQNLVTPERVKEAQAAGLQVVPWTANSPEEWQTLIDAGVDGIITDNPQGLVQYLRERDLH